VSVEIRDRIKSLRRVKAKDLIANKENWRRHSSEQAGALRAGLNEIGFADVVLAVERPEGIVLVDGHLRAEEVDPDFKVPTLILDLDDNEVRFLLASLDPMASMATTDKDALRDLLASIDTDSDQTLGLLEQIAHQEKLDQIPGDKSGREGTVGELPDEPTTKPGDVIRLGDHLLVCGDATAADVYEHLPRTAHMTFTDPPYNVDYEGRTADKLKIESDDMGDAEYVQFLRDSLGFIGTYTDGPVYMFYAATMEILVQSAWREAAMHHSSTIAWVKHHFVMGRSDYHWQWEPLMYGWQEGKKHWWCGDRNQGNVWNFDRPMANKLHPTMKPVALIEFALRNSSKPGDIVLDPFAGSGSTLIACENTDRVCFAVEIDPRYCDVIIERFRSVNPDATVETI